MRQFLTHLLLLLQLALALAVVACSDDSETGPVDDDDSAAADDDDDSSFGGDDDDSATGVDSLGIRYVTFAAMLDGSPEALSVPGAESTLVSGSFQFVYWSDLHTAAIVCRQHFHFDAVARFGTAQSSPCEGCGGQLSMMAVQPDHDEKHTDLCPTLPAEVDLSFLLTANDVTVSADFRELALVSMERLLDSNWPLSDSGLNAAEIQQSYLEAGLEAYWIAMVGRHGWLAGKAGLADVATPWDEAATVLPMFVAYRNPVENPEGWALDGSCFLSTLWAVRVGDALGTDPLP